MTSSTLTGKDLTPEEVLKKLEEEDSDSEANHKLQEKKAEAPSKT